MTVLSSGREETMRPEWTVAVLWLIALVTTMLLTRDTGSFTFLGPVFAICMIGSVVTVKRSRGKHPEGR